MRFETIRRLYHLTEDCGVDGETIEKACKRWKSLPSILVDYYGQLGRYDDLNHAHNDLRLPNQLIDAGDYLIFYVENQYMVQWAFQKEDLADEDPPVYVSRDEITFQEECARLSDFLIWMAHFHAAFTLPFSGGEVYMATAAQALQIKKHYRRKPYKLQRWASGEFYGNAEDEVIYLNKNDDYDMMYACYDPLQFYEMKKFMDSLHLESY